ncbi:response regulator [bacterium]|nr:response regulator [bacterium]
MRILVVDDEKMLVHSLQRFLKLRGVEVISAYSGEEALQKLESDSIDIVITDIIMSPMDGTALVQNIRQKYKSVIIIVMTGILNIAATIKELENGADGYLIKPFSNLNYVWDVLQPWVKKFEASSDEDSGVS